MPQVELLSRGRDDMRRRQRRVSGRTPRSARDARLAHLLVAAGGGALRRALGVAARAMEIAQSNNQSPLPTSPINKGGRITLEQLKIQDIIGQGHFGTVYLVHFMRGGSTSTPTCAALKVLHRQQYNMPGMKDRARVESQVLKTARHPFVVRLVGAFRTNLREMALLMEYCHNGNLNEHLVRYGCPGLEETFVRKVLAEVVLALEYLHEDMHVAFRDL